MTVAFVLGNGVSRRNISLPYLKLRGKIYGCNALYKEFAPDALIATDKPIAEQIQKTGYALTNKFYTRKPMAGQGGYPVPEQYYGYSSGPIALAVSCEDGARIVYLLGFDMGPDVDNHFNNIYANTEFYKSAGASPTFAGNWIKQVCRIVTDYPLTEFYRITGPTTARITELEALRNLQHYALDTFVDRINNQKDL